MANNVCMYVCMCMASYINLNNFIVFKLNLIFYIQEMRMYSPAANNEILKPFATYVCTYVLNNNSNLLKGNQN